MYTYLHIKTNIYIHKHIIHIYQTLICILNMHISNTTPHIVTLTLLIYIFIKFIFFNIL